MLTIFSHNHFFKKAMRLKINDKSGQKGESGRFVLNKVRIQQLRAVPFFDKQL